ncbi:MAG: SCO family protein [Pseudomonadota bacterium]
MAFGWRVLMAAGVLGVFVAAGAVWWGGSHLTPAPVAAKIGGPFTLVGTKGQPVTRADILGRPHAVFFGYTFCPDICPTTLFEMSGHLEALGAAGDRLDVYFISVDGTRDTPAHLGRYVSAFDPRIAALTGTKAQIDEAVAAYRVRYKIHPPNERGHYLIDHTATVLLFDENGAFQGTIGYGEDVAVARAKLKRLAQGA